MVVRKKLYTDEEFERFIEMPENRERRFELMQGEIIEVPSNAYCSEIAMLIVYYLLNFVLTHGNMGHVTGEGGGYIVAGARLAPDVAYISRNRQPVLEKRRYNPNPPELAVEVISPTDEEDDLQDKLKKYAEAHVLLWVVRPDSQLVEIHAPGQPIRTVDIDGTLTGGDVLPDFTLPVQAIFPA